MSATSARKLESSCAVTFVQRSSTSTVLTRLLIVSQQETGSAQLAPRQNQQALRDPEEPQVPLPPMFPQPLLRLHPLLLHLCLAHSDRKPRRNQKRPTKKTAQVMTLIRTLSLNQESPPQRNQQLLRPRLLPLLLLLLFSPSSFHHRDRSPLLPLRPRLLQTRNASHLL